jgi:NADH:ubiquinone oxidoreductase subunit 6 (subunit J)
MTLAAFTILALLIVAGAIAAITLRNLVHCALALTVSFAGLAGVYLELNAQFVGFAQILVYIGAVAILIVFAILLTRGREPQGAASFSASWLSGAAVALVVFGLLAGVVLSSHALGRAPVAAPAASVRQIGEQLMTQYVLPLEVLGLLLTAALLGAVVLAMREPSHGGHEPAAAGISPGHRDEGPTEPLAASATQPAAIPGSATHLSTP